MLRLCRYMLCVWLALSLSACGVENEDREALKDRALGFSQVYFAGKYQDAMTWVDEKSQHWLYFGASQWSEEDLRDLRQQDADLQCKVVDVHVEKEDSVASVLVEVRNFWQLQDLEAPGQMVEKGYCVLWLRKEDSVWKVVLHQLPHVFLLEEDEAQRLFSEKGEL